MNIKWSKYIPDNHKPHAKQLAYLALPHLEALYGGAAGGGKSDALLMGALAWCDCEDFSGIIFRRTFADMKLPSSILSRAKEWLAPFIATKEVKFVPSEHTFYFASGARLAFGYLRNAGSEHRYQSSEYQYVAFDELTHFQEKEYEYLFSRLRKVGGSVIPIKMRAASNPGGVGHVWVKSRFKITKGENGVWYGADPKIPFVPATIDDNPAIRLEEYEASLNKLGQVERERLRNGDWDVSERALFDDQWFYNRYVTKTRGLDTWYHMQPFEKTDRIIVHEPDLFVFTTIDSAASKKTGIKDISYIENKRPSHSVISTWGLTNKYDLLLLDNIRVQTTIPQLVNLICTNQRQWQPTYNIIEKNGPGEGVCQMAIQKGLPVRPVPTTRDKVQNSIAAQIRAEEGRIWLPAYRPWLKEWQEEVFVWTGSDAQPDDQVDCFSNAASHAMELAVGFERDSSLRQGLRRAIPTSALHNGIYSEKSNKIGGSETRHLARSIYSGKRYSGGLDYLR